MRTRTKGIQLASDGSRSVDKQYKGSRIFERLGKVSQDEAESWLRQRQAELDAERENQLRSGDQQLFAAAAQKYLIESERKKLRSLETVAYHVALLLPYVGSMALADICNDSLQPFIDERLDEDEVKPSTVNRTLEVARTIMNRAARLWRTNGKPWLATAPLIEMLDETGHRVASLSSRTDRADLPLVAGDGADLVAGEAFGLNFGYGFSDRSQRAYAPRLMTDALHTAAAEIRRICGAEPVDALAVSLGCEFLARAAAEQARDLGLAVEKLLSGSQPLAAT